MSKNTMADASLQPLLTGELAPGIPYKPAADLVWSLDHLGSAFERNLLPPGLTDTGVRAAAALMPLIVRIKQGEEVPKDELKPHYGNMVALDPLLNAAANVAFFVGGHWWMRNLVIKKFPEMVRSEKLKAKANQYLDIATKYTTQLGEIPSPKEQFNIELAAALEQIRTVARQHRAERTGVQPNIDDYVTANDAAAGVENLARTVLFNETNDAHHLPMLRRLVATFFRQAGKTPKSITLDQRYIAAAAPEIIDALERVLPEAQRNPRFLRSVERHPSSLRIGAEWFKRTRLNAIESDVPRLLRSLRALLPARGADANGSVDWLRRLINWPSLGSKTS